MQATQIEPNSEEQLSPMDVGSRGDLLRSSVLARDWKPQQQYTLLVSRKDNLAGA